MNSPWLDGSDSPETGPHPQDTSALTAKRAWRLLLAIVQRVRTRGPIATSTGVSLDSFDELIECPPDDAALCLDPAAPRGWLVQGISLSESTVDLLDLFVPLCVGTRATDLVVGHLAQTLDGRVATRSGSSKFISGHEDLTHTHRLRAVFDAVVVGAHTVERDDPRLTTRLATGPNPTRVIIDPTGRLSTTHHVFAEPDAPTIWVREPGQHNVPSHVDVIHIDIRERVIDAHALLGALAQRGLRRIFIEGGGVTVSGFLHAGVLDRLHLTVAPVLMGSGRPSLTLPEIVSLDEATRVACHHFVLGPDILFDCPLRS